MQIVHCTVTLINRTEFGLVKGHLLRGLIIPADGKRTAEEWVEFFRLDTTQLLSLKVILH